MSLGIPKHSRIKLQPDDYADLCREVLSRDNWRCQSCGRAGELQVHHLRFRSALGADNTENLITLCVFCHEKIHRRTVFGTRTPEVT
jgi:5-methylcytosine-specific restriction endonuclease McrA